ncbi:putative G-protein coupled receptor 52 [Orchesella cincta]|uniref:Putative G-protein coupled receptor 52 n=1 Tax=Orchesella cincta TaxID=48709 RepID=A0A1D2NDL1_ORCCI|nr:putative G-protein coupled receptor 52 [Orchesella cincta]
MFFNKDGNIVILDDGIGGIEIPIEHLIQAIIVLSVGVLVIVTNVIIIATFITAPGPREVLTYYLLSLAVADLLAGVLVVPLSVYPTLVHHWMYGDVLCKASGYLGAVLWTASIYTLMWMSVDRYVAVRKPIRYEVIQTRTRIQCWVAVSWISALMLCCPPLLGFRGASYDKEAAVCLLEWNVMPAYAATLASLILGPTITTMAYTYYFIFAAMKKLKSDITSMDKEYASALTETLANPAHLTSFILVVFFWVTWLPFLLITFLEYLAQWKIQIQFLHFTVFWMGMCNSFWKLLIYLAVNKNFRFQLRIFCLSLCCRTKNRLIVQHGD